MRMRINVVVMAILAAVVVLMIGAVGERAGRTHPSFAATTAADVRPSDATTPPAPTAATAPAKAVDAPPTTQRSGEAGTYTAVWGDTVSDLAAEMDGGNDKPNRAAVIHANQSLRHNPDRLLAGQTYDIPADGTRAPSKSATASPSASPSHPAPSRLLVVPGPDGRPHQLWYTARTGDTVSMLAAVLLGNNDKANRDTIVRANPSLQSDPDHLVDGRVYRIPVAQAHPLSAAPLSTTPAAARPAAQPDADDVVEAASARQLHYTARPGDTVSALALALLGSDTPATRAVIVGHNPSLQRDPDHVVAGQTYWITAPTAAPQE